MNDAKDILHILRQHRTIAVVGLSPKPERDSHEVAEYMQRSGYRIIPVNPAAGVPTILGEPVYSSLTDAARHAQIDLVDVFRRSGDVPPVAEEAIRIGAKGLWLQLGIAHPQAAAEARAAGLRVVQNACWLVEHRRAAQA
jgi:predicted CoA-binding protein